MSGAADLAPATTSRRRPPSTDRVGGGLAQQGSYLLVAVVAVIGSVVLCTAVFELTSHQVLHRAMAQFLLTLAALVICPAVAGITMSLTAADRPVRPARRVAFSVIAVIAVTLAELGVLARVGLGEADASSAAMQQGVVVYCILLGFIIRAVVRGNEAEVSSWWGWGLLAFLAVAWYASRPGPDTAPQTVVGAGYPKDLPDPLIELALLALSARYLGRYATAPRQEGTLFSDLGHVLRALAGPAVAVVFFAFTRDPAALALVFGSVALWLSLEYSAGRTVPLRMWVAVGVFLEIAPMLVLIEAHLYGYRTFRFDSMLRLVTGPSPFPVRTGAAYWVAPANAAGAKQLVHLVPASTRDGALMNAGLFVLAATLGVLAVWLARQVRDAPVRALATGLAAFVAVQCFMPFVGIVHLYSFGLSIPLLSGSWIWGIANTAALGTIAGLAQRGTRRPREPSTPDPRPATPPRKEGPNAGR